ncbi:MAG: helix-turn-helix domain-containing protein [Anaerolineae bacterium]|nr:helix-turn-helix domain-containing protein [Chloroflexota bacterium]MBP6298190.1 helix-turn-helix domain-containing protein [Anaerolineae bacterium]
MSHAEEGEKPMAAGESLAEIARDYAISPQRISQIVRRR